MVPEKIKIFSPTNQHPDVMFPAHSVGIPAIKFDISFRADSSPPF
jgi:hypothetical protein